MATSAVPRYQESSYPLCQDLANYQFLAKIGQGTFDEVFKARNRRSKEVVALKKVLIQNEEEGFPITTLREIKFLQVLKHQNIVNLIEVCRVSPAVHNAFKSTMYLAFEFCEHDLAGLLNNPQVRFSLAQIKNLMQQLLNGLYFVHANNLLHRDLKPANILVTKTGEVKLADFGLARNFADHLDRYTPKVITLWYRPPELLLGQKKYGPAIDLWGAGCIMAEMWTRRPLMQGTSEQNQLVLISNMCGSITPDAWPGVEKLELFKNIHLPKGQKSKITHRLRHLVKDQYACDLIEKLLSLDPTKRGNCDNALDHDFFWVKPEPQDLKLVLSNIKTSMFSYLNTPQQRIPLQQQPQQSAASIWPTGFNSDQLFDRIY